MATLNRWIGASCGIAAAVLVALAGCTQNADNDKKDDSKPIVQVEKKDNDQKTISAQPVSRLKAPGFSECVILDPPRDELRPPDTTVNGKNAAKLFELIANDLWDKVAFTTSDGKRIRYQAIMTTELGDVHIDLFGDVAPNHVRSFICLAKAGYYDGMSFYYTLNRVIEGTKVAYIETGCPKGNAEEGHGSIGYWLKPEISDKATHEEGAVGACLREDPNSAACRFYITAAAIPPMDGSFTVFGKVSKGLDVVRTINTREVNEFDRPKAPVAIKSVTIRTIID